MRSARCSVRIANWSHAASSKPAQVLLVRFPRDSSGDSIRRHRINGARHFLPAPSPSSRVLFAETNKKLRRYGRKTNFGTSATLAQLTTPSCQSVIEYKHRVGGGGSRFSLPWEHLGTILFLDGRFDRAQTKPLHTGSRVPAMVP